MKTILPAFALFLLFGCEDNSQKTDKEKAESETKIEIKTDSTEVKIGESGVSIKGKGEDADSVNIKINADDGIKIEDKDGKIELKTEDGGKLKIEKKGKDVNIQIKEN
jgi:hypothetical protein